MSSEQTGSPNFKERFFAPMPFRSWAISFALLLLLALALRTGLAIPALKDASTLLRPDSMGYWSPACALAAGDGFVGSPGSTTPEMIRPIGYPLVLSLVIKFFGNNFLWGALLGIALSVSAILPIVLAGRKLVCDRVGLLAGLLYALNLTSIADAPLILSDTLLGVLAAWQIFFVIFFMKEKKLLYLAALTLTGIAGALVKPVNMPVVLIGLPLILIAGTNCRKDFFLGLLIIAAGVGALLIPYWVHNVKLSGDFDGNTANAYFHNGSAILAHATGESSEEWRKRLLAKAEKEFSLHPEKYATLKAQNQWKKAQFRELVKQYPVDAVITHLPNIFNLLPDVPTLLENNRVTTGERGTMAVLRQKGFFAAVNHYLDGRWYILIVLAPLLAVYALTLAAAALRLVIYLVKWQWRWLLIFGVTVFYYIWAPGPVISPRYLLPALPMIILMALHIKNNISITERE